MNYIFISVLFQIDYYLEENDNWSINPEELSVALETGGRYCIPKAILVINPGNPTGEIFENIYLKNC